MVTGFQHSTLLYLKNEMMRGEGKSVMLGSPSHLINIIKSFFVYMADNKMIESISNLLKLKNCIQ